MPLAFCVILTVTPGNTLLHIRQNYERFDGLHVAVHDVPCPVQARPSFSNVPMLGISIIQQALVEIKMTFLIDWRELIFLYHREFSRIFGNGKYSRDW